MIQLADRILVQALSRQASDIHIEPQEDGLHVRLRLDGVLQNAFETLPAKVIPALTSRFKILADLDIAERRQPQDGRIRRRYQGNTVDFRVSVLPSRFGEKIVLRLLDSSATELGLDLLITDSQALAEVRDMGSKPYGILLVTGPTGSGKSTTLYSLLAERNDPGLNISTVEDPIEYTLPGITQTQVNREKGVDFAKALRAFMRQDPDVLLVGETRDLETAKTALEAALTGHLVLTTLHCNDAPQRRRPARRNGSGDLPTERLINWSALAAAAAQTLHPAASPTNPAKPPWLVSAWKPVKTVRSPSTNHRPTTRVAIAMALATGAASAFTR